MELILTHALLLLFGLSVAFLNIYLGFLGLVVGDYRFAKKSAGCASLCGVHKKFEEEVWRALGRGDISVKVFALVMAHVGIAFLFLTSIGPHNENPWVEPEKNIK